MSTTPEFMSLHNWLVDSALLIYDTPLEQMLDIIIGKPNQDDVDDFTSPLYNYFFSTDKIKNSPEEYLTYLEALKAIRAKLREYRPDQKPTLSTFIEFIDLNRKIGDTINIARPTSQAENAVNIMTTHKSKGLEFDTVYVMNAVDTVWGEGTRSKSRMIQYPENLPLAPAGENSDERLRLFYVAITRAKKQLHISYSLANDNDKKTLPAAFLLNSHWQKKPIKSPDSLEKTIEIAEVAWYKPLVSPITVQMQDLLMPNLENYRLSVTHLNNFLDVASGGPNTFLLNNLLRFPSAKSPSAAFGTAIHNTLQEAHNHLAATGNIQAIEDIVSNFETNLKNQYLPARDFEKFLQKGSDVIRLFLETKYQTFTDSQKTELDFTNQHCIVGEAHLSGKLDLVDIDKTDQTITITDYKTGKPSANWTGSSPYEKIKLHKYKQQLLFYKLLVENSRDFHSYDIKQEIMQFVEPDTTGRIISLSTQFSNEEVERFSKLINAVWQHIKTLDLPDTSHYEPSIKGILAFEQDLLDNYEQM